jgi:carbon monoxide dehydrogenase subunit G
MELTNEFVIDRGVEETWKILNDLEFIAPCMPGAQLQEIEGDEYRGIVKVKVGPITAQYKGKASFVEQDAANKVARLKAEGRDPRQGNANAMITASMAAVGEARTTVKIHTDLGLSGKIASFGRGAIEDVSKKILGQFTDNLREKLENEVTAAPPQANGDSAPQSATATATAAAPAAPAADAGPASPAAAASTSAATAAEPGASPATASERSAVRRITGPEAEPVDLLAVSGGTLAKRVVPAAGGLAIIVILLYWLLGRG